MPDWDYEDLANHLLEENKNVILIDTCILLDIVRCDDVKKYYTAKKMMESLQNNDATFNSVIPSPVLNEWNNHISELCTEVKRIVETSYQQSKIIETILKCENPDLKLQIDDFRNHGIGEKLKNISETILQSSYICKVKPIVQTRAFQRMSMAKLPSKKGRPSPNDCLIFEELLELATILRDNGFNNQIFFVSSNTKDFGEGSNSGSEMNMELQTLQIKYISNLLWLDRELGLNSF